MMKLFVYTQDETILLLLLYNHTRTVYAGGPNVHCILCDDCDSCAAYSPTTVIPYCYPIHNNNISVVNLGVDTGATSAPHNTVPISRAGRLITMMKINNDSNITPYIVARGNSNMYIIIIKYNTPRIGRLNYIILSPTAV